MAKRRTIKRISDLLPDILIEAQRCDAITAQKVLEHAAEDLAYNYGFFRLTQTFSIGDTTPTEKMNHVDCYVLYLDEMEALSVEKVEGLLDNNETRVMGGYFFDAQDGKLYVQKTAVPGDDARLLVHYSALPGVDDDVSESAALTRGRRVLLSLALYELFSQAGTQWGNPDRAAFWMRCFNEALETWNYNERFRNQTGGIIIANNPFAV